MKILWSSPTPMIASDIVKKDSSLNINTVQACLRELIKDEIIKVADIVYSGTVLTRSYIPSLTKEEYFTETYKDVVGTSPFSLCASLIETETDLKELKELEKLIAQKRAELEEE